MYARMHVHMCMHVCMHVCVCAHACLYACVYWTLIRSKKCVEGQKSVPLHLHLTGVSTIQIDDHDITCESRPTLTYRQGGTGQKEPGVGKILNNAGRSSLYKKGHIFIPPRVYFFHELGGRPRGYGGSAQELWGFDPPTTCRVTPCLQEARRPRPS